MDSDITAKTNTAFQYKICLPKWTLKVDNPDKDMKVGACKSDKGKALKAKAFMSEFNDADDDAITERVCEYSFGEPMF